VHPDNLDELLNASDWTEWAEYFLWKDTRRDKMDFYLAQLAAYLSGKKRARIAEFMLPDRKAGHGPLLSAKDAAMICKARFGNA